MRTAASSAAEKPSTAPAKLAPAPGRSFIGVLDERMPSAPKGPPMPPTPAAQPATPTPAAPARIPAGPVRAMLERALGSEKQIDALLDAAARGKTFKPGELLAMQATVARYSQTVEVVSRVADRLVGAIKQTMGTQV